MMSTQRYEGDEIDLRDYFNVIVKRKKVIYFIFFFCIIVSIIISFILPKVYQASASIMIIPSKISTTLSPREISLNVDETTTKGEYISRRPAISLPTHRTLLLSNVVLKRVIDKFSLINKTNGIITINSLSSELDIHDIKDTGILQLEVQDRDAIKAKEIANVWAQEYILYNQELILGEVAGMGDFITDQFELAKKNLMQAEKKVKDFKDAFKLDLMDAELTIKKDKLNAHKKELEGLEIDIKVKDASLKELQKEIIKQDKFIIVSKAITDDALWQQFSKDENGDSFNKKKLRSELINPIYQDLDKRMVNSEIELNTLKPKFGYLTKSIEVTAKEIDELEKIIHQKQIELTELTRQVAIYQTTYNNLSAKIEEARIINAAQLGEVKLVSPAIEPIHPIKPKRKRIVAISGILGLFIAIFMAFWLEFWEKGKTNTE